MPSLGKICNRLLKIQLGYIGTQKNENEWYENEHINQKNLEAVRKIWFRLSKLQV